MMTGLALVDRSHDSPSVQLLPPQAWGLPMHMGWQTRVVLQIFGIGCTPAPRK